ncbi:rop guanine nucleotide exchange factor 12-like [Pyrus x bretschneideri]|uniref:rop guanine nucleotide exchange factor 12-like n=1 Tax=Pyrus x bretschneideri TaxID=225117 RepID=UPI00202DD541|nr:rop guanine nucleotide exchange factor 12-like [Pyrus x bretschneideri]
MVRALEEEEEDYKSRLYHFKGMHENAGRHTKSLSIESATVLEFQDDDKKASSRSSNGAQGSKSQLSKEEAAAREAREKQQQTDMEQMKERFAKLLLGEDMSGGGKGVSSALALSNAITNLAASVFGEQTRLEPMSTERKKRWRKEIDWFLCVSDYIVEFVASQQKGKDGTNMEIMVTQQRTDLHMNIPALRKLDAMLIDCLDNFQEKQEFYYVSKDADENEKGSAKRKDDKWWLPTPKVPPNGLSDAARKFIQYQKDCVNQVLKAAMAINAQVLTEMEIPENYIESLPKNGRASLGDTIYRSITVEFFDPDQFLCSMDLSSEHKILDLKNKMEASMVIWKRKMNQKDGKSGWGSAVSLEKRELFEERAETILLLLKQRFPGIPQSSLDVSKIEYNADVGQAILESYSRILESLAFTVLSRIEDVLYADFVTQNPSHVACKRPYLEDNTIATSPDRSSKEENAGGETPCSMTLSDFMGWGADQSGTEPKKDPDAADEDNCAVKHPHMQKIANIVTNKKISYLENLGGLRSPTARH